MPLMSGGIVEYGPWLEEASLAKTRPELKKLALTKVFRGMLRAEFFLHRKKSLSAMAQAPLTPS